MNLNPELPPLSQFALRAWNKSHGGDYYGALQVAANYCGIDSVPLVFPGVWQHGIMPPWYKLQPEITVFNAPRSHSCFVARQDEVAYVRQAGYDQVRAIGLPIIYTRPSGVQRMAGSLLVMPTHSLPRDERVPSFEKYVSQIASIQAEFSRVVVCVSAACIANGLWKPQFEARGMEVVCGAGISDANALKRMRALFESFEFVTTDSFGSHVFYALYFGAKVSIWGEATPIYRENVLKDATWTPFPHAVDKLLSRDTELKAEEYLGPLRVNPRKGVQDIKAGNWMLGHENKLGPAEMQECFGWTPLVVMVSRFVHAVRGWRFPRAAAKIKRRV